MQIINANEIVLIIKVLDALFAISITKNKE